MFLKKMDLVNKPLCEYGAKCYRKNPEHLKKYSHAQPETKKETKEPDSKKPKLDIIKTPVEKEKKKVIQTTLNFKKKSPNQPTRTSPRKGQTNPDQDKPKYVKKDEKIGSSKKSPIKPKVNDTSKKEKEPAKNEKGNQIISESEEEEEEEKEKEEKEEGDKDEGEDEVEVKIDVKVAKAEDQDNAKKVSDNNDEENNEEETTGKWTYVKKSKSESQNQDSNIIPEDLDSKTNEEIIKMLFLFDMPSDFYNFYSFCQSLSNNQPLKALESCGLTLVGPFDVLAGRMKLSCDKELALCHWRFYYDPPEFQTVLAGSKGFHIGYWRDNPQDAPVFVASNNSRNDCIFKIEGENIFAGLHNYLKEYMKTCNPFSKMKISKLQTQVADWAEKNEFSVESMTENIKRRQKKIAAKTFHRAGMVVPVERKTELGYRPLLETDAQLKKICKLIIDSTDDDEREGFWENLQPLITAANIANDECDFGNSLELGIDLFCMGSSVFHETISHLMGTAYILLNRPQFAQIIKAHLKFRRKETNLSVI